MNYLSWIKGAKSNESSQSSRVKKTESKEPNQNSLTNKGSYIKRDESKEPGQSGRVKVPESGLVQSNGKATENWKITANAAAAVGNKEEIMSLQC